MVLKVQLYRTLVHWDQAPYSHHSFCCWKFESLLFFSNWIKRLLILKKGKSKLSLQSHKQQPEPISFPSLLYVSYTWELKISSCFLVFNHKQRDSSGTKSVVLEILWKTEKNNNVIFRGLGCFTPKCCTDQNESFYWAHKHSHLGRSGPPH